MFLKGKKKRKKQKEHFQTSQSITLMSKPDKNIRNKGRKKVNYWPMFLTLKS